MKENFLRPFSLFVLSVLIVVLSIEIIFQSFFPENIVPDLHQSKYSLPNVLRSNLDIKLDWSHGYLYPPFRIQTNSKSFLSDREFQYKKPENTYRILMLGNSIFMGLGVENKELFSKYLEDILNERSREKNIEVINLSGVAWSVVQFLIFLQVEGYKYDPDLVLISQGENDFRVEYNKLIQVNKIKKIDPPTGKLKINLGDLEIKLRHEKFISNIWEWVRKFPFYLDISKHSQLLHRIRSKVNSLWLNKYPRVSKKKQLGHFFETNNIEITKDTIISFNSDNISVNPEGHSVTYYSKAYNRNMYEANANIVLHSAIKIKISQFLTDINAKFVDVDIPAEQETIGAINTIGTRNLSSSARNYFYLNPTKIFNSFQSNNIEIPLYFYSNNHLSPAGNRLLAILAYNFLTQNNLIPTQNSWKQIDPFAEETIRLIKKSNNRIEEFVQTDNRLHKFRGLLYRLKGDYYSSRKSFSNYLKKEKNDFEAHFLLGKVLLKLREFSLALASFKKSLDGHPLEVKRYKYAYNFTKIYKDGIENLQNGNLDKAITSAKELEKLRGEWWAQGIFFNYIVYQKMGQLNNAELYIKQAVELWPNNLKFKLIMASLKFDQKKYEEAINFSSQILKQKQNDLKALLILGVSYAALGNKKEALDNLSKYLSMDGNNKTASSIFRALQKS